MVQSKAWNWETVDSEIWTLPSEESYYLLERWKRASFATFLDLGCGLGRHSLQFALTGFEVSAFDLSEYAIDSLRGKAAALDLDISAVSGDMLELPYGDAEFDCILGYHVISHTDRAGLERILSGIGRILKPNGELFITFCSKDSPSYSAKDATRIDGNTIIKNDSIEKGIPHFYCDVSDVRELLGGFSILRVRHITDYFDGGSSAHYFVLARKRE